jgi:hypothetical protein
MAALDCPYFVERIERRAESLLLVRGTVLVQGGRDILVLACVLHSGQDELAGWTKVDENSSIAYF